MLEATSVEHTLEAAAQIHDPSVAMVEEYALVLHKSQTLSKVVVLLLGCQAATSAAQQSENSELYMLPLKDADPEG